MREVAVKDKYGERQQLNGAADNHKEGEGDVGGERRESGWVPTSSNGIEVCLCACVRAWRGGCLICSFLLLSFARPI